MPTEQALWVTAHWSAPQLPLTDHWPAIFEHDVVVFVLEEQWMAPATINAMRIRAGERTTKLVI